MTNFLRAVGFTNTDANSSYFSLSNYSNNLNERPYRSGSVFNFFPPSYVIPGTNAECAGVRFGKHRIGDSAAFACR